MREIELHGKYANGMTAKVSNADYKELNQYRWFMSNDGYAITKKVIQGKSKTVQMHREIKSKSGLDTHHRNGDRTDNRRRNLDCICHAKNRALSKGLQKNNTSGYRGVYKSVARNGTVKFRALIHFNYKSISLGYFDCPMQASRVFQAKHKELLELY